eukprot:scaffold38702_cov62-Phaeocystis_antarctica.AAC.3
MARTAANIGGWVESIHHHNAKRSTCQETFRAYKAATFLDSGVANTENFESSVLAVPVTLFKSNHSIGVQVGWDWAQRYSSLPGLRQVLKPYSERVTGFEGGSLHLGGRHHIAACVNVGDL